MSESLRNDGRIWVPEAFDDTRSPDQIPESERDYYLERRYPAFGNLVPRDVASRAAKREVDAGRGVGPIKNGVYLDFGEAIQRLGRHTIEERYGNLFQMYDRITGEDPYKVPMRIYPAVHYTMGGLWVDYNLMSNVPGLFVLGEANFSDHGANRLGASALMQGLADGYFVLPATINDYLAPLLGSQPRRHRRPGVRRGRGQRRRADRAHARRQGDPHGRPLPPRARQDHVGRLRHGPQRREPRQGDRRDPGAARGVLVRRPHPRRRRELQPEPREGRPRRRLPRVRRAARARRPPPRRVVRRPLPRRVPDRGRRGAAPRRRVRVRRGVGVGGRRRTRPRSTRSSSSSRTSTSPSAATSRRIRQHGSDPSCLAPGRPRRRPVASRPTPCRA